MLSLLIIVFLLLVAAAAAATEVNRCRCEEVQRCRYGGAEVQRRCRGAQVPKCPGTERCRRVEV